MNRFPERDPYEVLHLKRGCTAADVKFAYKREALKTHPDRAAPGDREAATAKFKQIAEAYEYLSDDNKRRHYDLYGPGSTPMSASDQDADDASRKMFGTSPDGVPFSFVWESAADTARRAQRGRGAGRPFGADGLEPWQLFNSMFSQDFGSHHTRRDPFPPDLSANYHNNPFMQNHRAMADTMGFGFGTAPNGTTQSPFSHSTSSSSMSYSNSTSSSFMGYSHKTSQATSTRTVNGRTETVTRTVDAHGNETVYTTTPEGQTVTLNGVLQTRHHHTLPAGPIPAGSVPIANAGRGATADDAISVSTDESPTPTPTKTTFGFLQ